MGTPPPSPDEVARLRLAAIVESSDDAIVGTTLDGVITVWNRAAACLFGWTDTEALGRPSAMLWPAEAAADAAERLRRIGRGESVGRVAVDACARDGGRLALTLTVSPMRDDRGRIIGASLIGCRRTESAEPEIEALLAVSSHELRTALGTVLGWARMLRTGSLDAGRVARALETIERNTQRQVQLIENLIDVAKMVAGTLRLDRRPVDLGAVVMSAVRAARPAAEAKGISLETAVEPVPPMAGDADRLYQAIARLLANAIRFTPDGGRVEARLERGDDAAVVRVSDSGVGIAADRLPHLFGRGNHTSAAVPRSDLAVGLVIVRHVVEAHGGTVQATSDGPGHGAIFTVAFPLARP